MATATIHYNEGTTLDEGVSWRGLTVLRTNPPGCIVRLWNHDGGILAEAYEGDEFEIVDQLLIGATLTVTAPLEE